MNGLSRIGYQDTTHSVTPLLENICTLNEEKYIKYMKYKLKPPRL